MYLKPKNTIQQILTSKKKVLWSQWTKHFSSFRICKLEKVCWSVSEIGQLTSSNFALAFKVIMKYSLLMSSYFVVSDELLFFCIYIKNMSINISYSSFGKSDYSNCEMWNGCIMGFPKVVSGLGIFLLTYWITNWIRITFGTHSK